MANENELDGIDDNAPEAPKQLRKYAESKAAEAAKVPQLEKELAAFKAGIDVESRKGQAWLAGYAGDLTDKAAMIADATDFDASIVKAGTPAPVAGAEDQGNQGVQGDQTNVNNSQQSTGSAERTALADGALASGAATEDVPTVAMAAAKAAMDKGATQEESMGGYINALAKGVHEGKLAPLSPDGRRA